MTLQERLNLVNERNLNILAIDIGNMGGMVWNDHKTGEIVIVPMPEDIKHQWEWMRQSEPDIIIAENVHTMPLQGIVSNGTLMKNRGRVEGMASALGIEIHFINPLQWMECFTLSRTKHFKNKMDWKKHLIHIAKSIADSDDLIPLVNEKTADAFLMWNYSASQQTPEPIKPIGLKF